jgi:hypothetical protein
LNAGPSSSAARFRLRVAILAVLLVALAVTALVRATLLSFDFTCEVCVTFGGRTACREAVGRDRESAILTARRHACGYLAADEAAVATCLAAPAVDETCEGK